MVCLSYTFSDAAGLLREGWREEGFLFRLLRHLSSFQIISLSFLALIGAGTALLLLPVAVRSGEGAPLIVALFTAVSASCVTGLTLVDTASYWSPFGQAVILLLIQIGGLGVVTMAVAITVASGQRAKLLSRSTMQEALSLPQLGGIVQLLRFSLLATLSIELAGAALLYIAFLPDYGPVESLWLALFHAVSAFCNAGFDLMGDRSGGSLMAYAADPLVNIAICALIVLGGLGFLTLADLYKHGRHVRRWSFQTRAVLLMTVLLLFLPALLFYYGDFSGLSSGRGLAALFQSVTARTAGFNTVDIETMTEPSRLVLVLLMLIGGSPGSTAGGVKTTTVFTLFVALLSLLRHRRDLECLSRRISLETLQDAVAIASLYFLLFFAGTLLLSYGDGATVTDAMVETASALGTVGLSIGLTDRVSTLSQCVLMFLMYFGRVGALTLVYAFSRSRAVASRRLPQSKIAIG